MTRWMLATLVLIMVPWPGLACVEPVAELPDGPARAVELEGDLAVFGSGRVLIIADVSDPSQPVEVGRVVLTDVIEGIDVVGNRAYAAMGKAGLAIVDLSDLGAPFVLGSVVAEFGETIDVVVVEPHAYTVELERVTEYSTSIHLDVINVSDPGRPVLVGTVETVSRIPSKLAASGDVVYMASGPTHWPSGSGRAVSVYDVSDPQRPIELPLPSSSLMGADGIAVSGESLFVLGDENWYNAVLEIFDLGDPESPVRISRLDLDCTGQRDLAVFEDLAVVTTEDGLKTVDVSDPEHPAIVGSLDRPGRGLQVAVRGTIAAVAADADGLRFIDLSNPEEPTAVGGLETPGSADYINIVGDLTVVSAKWRTGLGVGDARLIDVSNPIRPAQFGDLPVVPYSGRVIVEDSRAYVMTGGLKGREPGLAVVDIADPTTPVELGFVPTDSTHFGMDVRWPYAYLVGLGGVRVIDVGDPSAPIMVHEMEIENGASSIALDEDYAYIGKFTNRPGIVRSFQVLDVSDPLGPAELGSSKMGPYWNLFVSDGLVCGASPTGMSIVDARDPMDPEHLYSTQMDQGGDYAVAVEGRTAAVIRVMQDWDRDSGYRDVVSVFHLDNPEWPRNVAMFEIPVRGKDVGFSDDFVFVAGGAAGIFIYDVSACGVPTTRRSTGRVTP